MKGRTLLAGGVIAVAAVLGGNEAQFQMERASAVAEFRQDPMIEMAKRRVGEEIKSLRTENSETFKGGVNLNGKPTVQTKIYAGQKYFKDANVDTLRPLDLTVHEVSVLAKLNPLRKFDKYVSVGPYTATWMNDKPCDIKMEVEGVSISYKAIYDDKNIDKKMDITPTGMKETITLLNKNAAHTLRWIVDTDGSLVAQADNSFIVRAKDGSTPLRIEPTVAWDAALSPVMVVASVQGDTLTFNVTVLPGQKFPVAVDPTTVYLSKAATLGGRVSNSSSVTYTTVRNAVTGSTTGQTLSVGQDSSSYYDIYRIFLGFPLKGSQIVSVSACSLKVYGVQDNSNTNFGLCVFGANAARPTITTADFSQFNGWQASGAYNGTTLNASFNTSSFLEGAWNSLIFLGAGIDSVANAKNDTLWVAIISSRDSSASPPIGASFEFISISFIGGGYPPYLSMTVDVNDSSASNLVMTAIKKDSIKVEFTDRSYTAGKFIVVNASDSTKVASSDSITNPSGIGTTVTTYVGGLWPNIKYIWKIMNLNLYSTADSARTRAAQPPAPTTTMIGNNMRKVYFDTLKLKNPGTTLYAFNDSGKAVNNYIMPVAGTVDIMRTGTSDSSWAWQTYSQWGMALAVPGDTTRYPAGNISRFRVLAKNSQ